MYNDIIDNMIQILKNNCEELAKIEGSNIFF